MAAVQPQRKLSFFDLPPEIRQTIYVETLQPGRFSDYTTETFTSLHFGPSHRMIVRNDFCKFIQADEQLKGSTKVLRLCRQIYDEAYVVFARIPLALDFFYSRDEFNGKYGPRSYRFGNVATSGVEDLKKNDWLVRRVPNLSISLNCVSLRY